jgi:hypothetical protein
VRLAFRGKIGLRLGSLSFHPLKLRSELVDFGRRHPERTVHVARRSEKKSQPKGEAASDGSGIVLTEDGNQQASRSKCRGIRRVCGRSAADLLGHGGIMPDLQDGVPRILWTLSSSQLRSGLKSFRAHAREMLVTA